MRSDSRGCVWFCGAKRRPGGRRRCSREAAPRWFRAAVAEQARRQALVFLFLESVCRNKGIFFPQGQAGHRKNHSGSCRSAPWALFYNHIANVRKRKDFRRIFCRVSGGQSRTARASRRQQSPMPSSAATAITRTG